MYHFFIIRKHKKRYFNVQNKCNLIKLQTATEILFKCLGIYATHMLLAFLVGVTVYKCCHRAKQCWCVLCYILTWFCVQVAGQPLLLFKHLFRYSGWWKLGGKADLTQFLCWEAHGAVALGGVTRYLCWPVLAWGCSLHLSFWAHRLREREELLCAELPGLRAGKGRGQFSPHCADPCSAMTVGSEGV